LFIFLVILAERVRPGVCHQSQAGFFPAFFVFAFLSALFFTTIMESVSQDDVRVSCRRFRTLILNCINIQILSPEENMHYQIQRVAERTLAGFHLVGPWEKTVPKGFEQLQAWVTTKQLVPREWIAVYFGNPELTPPEALRCDTMISVDPAFEIPPNSEGVTKTRLAAGLFAVARVQVADGDFTAPWLSFFTAVSGDGAHQLREGPVFEIYLSDGSNGVWDIEMYIPVALKQAE
jgi:DNA gyrase inhibitor